MTEIRKSKGASDMSHVLTDVLGIVLGVVVTAASVQDRDGFALLTKDIETQFPTIKTILVDGVYNGDPIRQMMARTGVKVRVSEKPTGVPGFVPVRKRWAVERTFGWLTWERLLNRCYERHPSSEAAWIYLASATRLARVLQPEV